MSEDDRAAKAARAKALLKKRQSAKKDKPSGSGTGTGVASPVSERAFSPAPPEDSKPTRDLSDIFSKGDTS
ncbi:hypothetical protein MPER_10347, partial [Moniliophthora perniciosa FA553]